MKYATIAILVLIFLIVAPASAQTEWCGSQTLYFQHQYSADFPTYEELQNFPLGNPEVDENVTVINTAGPVLIDTYIMPAGAIETQSKLLKGLRVFTTWHYVSSSVGTTQINFTAFQRKIDGSETIFYSQLSDDIDALTVTDYTTYRISTEDLILYPGDRLGIKVYAQTTHSSPITVHFVYQGTTHASHFETGFFDCTPPPPAPTIPSLPAGAIDQCFPWWTWIVLILLIVIAVTRLA